MFDTGRIDAAAVGQNPAFLLGVKRDLVAVVYRLLLLGFVIRQAVDELAAFEGLGNDLGGIIRLHFLVLNPHGLNGNHRRLGAKTVAAGGTDFHLIRNLLAFDLVI